MNTLRPAADRGHFKIDWLNSHHSFSFGEYYDPEHMGVSNLRVINDDTVAPGGGFATHGHQDMEIVSYVLAGELEHRDSMGNGSVIRPGDVQRMSAGRGVRHSEYNPSADKPVHFLQIWLQPNQKGIEPGYEQKTFPKDQRRGQLALLVSPDGREGSLTAFQDALMFGAMLGIGESVEHTLAEDRVAYVHLASGEAEINGQAMEAGDGLTLAAVGTVTLKGIDEADLLLFDLPA